MFKVYSTKFYLLFRNFVIKINCNIKKKFRVENKISILIIYMYIKINKK